MVARRYVVIIAIAAFLAGILVATFLAGEWKPVGDGETIMHSRTGEVKPATNDLDLSEISGTWFKKSEDKPGAVQEIDMVSIGPSSIQLNKTTYAAVVIDCGNNASDNPWWVVAVTVGNYKSNWRIDFLKKSSTILLNNELYTDEPVDFRPLTAKEKKQFNEPQTPAERLVFPKQIEVPTVR
jgi:hypothetical protein